MLQREGVTPAIKTGHQLLLKALLDGGRGRAGRGRGPDTLGVRIVKIHNKRRAFIGRACFNWCVVGGVGGPGAPQGLGGGQTGSSSFKRAVSGLDIMSRSPLTPWPGGRRYASYGRYFTR